MSFSSSITLVSRTVPAAKPADIAFSVSSGFADKNNDALKAGKY